MRSESETCASCAAFIAPPSVHEAHPMASQLRGECRRFPASVPKRGDSWCFEFLPLPGGDGAEMGADAPAAQPGEGAK